MELFKSISLILAVFIGVNSGNMMAGKTKKPRPQMTRNLQLPCMLGVLPVSTGYSTDNKIANSIWRASCSNGNTGCNISVKALIYRQDPVFGDELIGGSCIADGLGCGTTDPNLEVTYDMSSYGPGFYRINWIFYNGDCTSTKIMGMNTQYVVISTGIHG